MHIPSSTYRLQFRNGMTFDRAVDLVPYLASLGISHLYASPIFTAVTGSTHGYDVVKANEIEPAIGGRDGFERLAAALHSAGLGLILDIVPNHMAASIENPWWRDVLHKGSRSAYAGYFDIDWSRKLTLPILGQPLQDVLSAGDLELVRDDGSGCLNLKYFDNLLPLNDESVGPDLAGLDRETLRAFSRDTGKMEALLEEQHWELIHWKDAARQLSYRRFFEITGLVGMRVEDEAVFQDTHRLILNLVKSGKVQGLRIDHVDGLADPEGYLNRLRQAAGPETYIIVEKILGPGEELPSAWPVSGTTGYEFILALSHLFIDKDGLHALQAEYCNLDAANADFEQGLRSAKKLMVERNFEGEVTRLSSLAARLAPQLEAGKIRAALQELLIAFPVYRTYGYRDPLAKQDREVLSKAVAEARLHLQEDEAIDLLECVIEGEIDGDPAFEMRARFQQLSGPVMAKAMEDTLFYRHNRLLAANEVGGEPNAEPGGIAAFHRAMTKRAETQPNALSATATHDTKRGEDARARLYTLSEGADRWVGAVKRWRKMNEPALARLPDGRAPEPNAEWMLYQALAGIWPQDIDKTDLGALARRLTDYAQKALREAKLRTDWTAPNEDYEKAVIDYAARLLSPANKAFLDDFRDTVAPFIEAGHVNSLAQTLIKLTAPGIPDIYQGTEGADFSLVDPDNRREVDYRRFDMNSDSPFMTLSLEERKRHLIKTVLGFRRANPELFLKGKYAPLEVVGARRDQVLAFARVLGREHAVTIVPRMMFGAEMSMPDFWQNTDVVLPGVFPPTLKNLFTGVTVARGTVPVAEILGNQAVCLLVGRDF